MSGGCFCGCLASRETMLRASMDAHATERAQRRLSAEQVANLIGIVGDYRAAVAAERAAHDATPVGVMSADEFEKLKALIRRRVEIHERLLEVAE